MPRFNLLSQLPKNSSLITTRVLRLFSHCSLSSEAKEDVERIARIINDHPFPEQPLRPALLEHIPPPVLSDKFVESVLGRLFAAHSNGLKALEFFDFALSLSKLGPSRDAFEKTLHILVRMRYFDRAWDLMGRITREHPSLLTLKSMSIVLSKIAKFQSYEETLEAFEKMEREVFVGWKFGTDEFNVLLRAFCTHRQMKEAKSVFVKMHSRFPPDKKSMNILLLGFKESGDITSVELFYHEMVARGFEPNSVTYNIRIDAHCKKGRLTDALRILEEMERQNLSPTIETLTTLIHGAGVAQNPTKARELFEEITLKKLSPDTGAYNAFMSSLIRCNDLDSAVLLMDEMDKKCISPDYMTYHNMFFGMIRSSDFDGVFWLYDKMIERKIVPKTNTVVALMKFFCQNSRIDKGLHFWSYLLGKGYCPHSHALELLLTGLCARGLTEEAFVCSKQVLERGRRLSEAAYRMVERLLCEDGDVEKLTSLHETMKKLHTHLPPGGEDSNFLPQMQSIL